MAEVADVISSIKSGDYGDATKMVNDILSQKTLDAINSHRQEVGNQMLGQTSLNDEELEGEENDDTEETE